MFDIVNIFLFLFSIFFAIGAYRLGLGSLEKPGPGFIIFLASMVLLISSAYRLLFSKGDIPLRLAFPRKGLKRVLLIVISLLLYAKLMPVGRVFAQHFYIDMVSAVLKRDQNTPGCSYFRYDISVILVCLCKIGMRVARRLS